MSSLNIQRGRKKKNTVTPYWKTCEVLFFLKDATHFKLIAWYFLPSGRHILMPKGRRDDKHNRRCAKKSHRVTVNLRLNEHSAFFRPPRCQRESGLSRVQSFPAFKSVSVLAQSINLWRTNADSPTQSPLPFLQVHKDDMGAASGSFHSPEVEEERLEFEKKNTKKKQKKKTVNSQSECLIQSPGRK